ncbi:LOW QUALITY PROTEIN: glutathione hydrolase 5 proenzyme [Rhinatrema bivittatum]|uniref:LOW QUALITY PROTEIN: glutathione hydrolase 5 proenzyme n=1 Tax=Rhinatrema bivittatum TaxID=194408 RepID=UPI00112CAF28|nr:LOW QUALITY PROTEIN: glutathione hydrolase 5 proenzyme [Rhinatrema bivittatum]
MAVTRGWACCLMLLALAVLGAVVTLVALLIPGQSSGCAGGFSHAAVAADAGACSNIARDILRRGGSAVDAAIAALLCTSAMNPQSMGIGGGVIFTIYDASTGIPEVIMARERAPENTLPDCAQWIGVPGELRGYEEAHKRHGKLPWRVLFEPTIKLVTEGFPVPEILERSPADTQTGEETLRIVAEEGAGSFYEGPLAQLMVEDLKTQHASLTLDDFRNYQVERVEALNVSIDDYTLYSPSPTCQAAILSFILNIMKGYGFSSDSLKNDGDRIETFHRFAEALKFANGQKSKIMDHVKSGKRLVIDDLLSDSFAGSVRKRIDRSGNHSLSYYNLTQLGGENFGTTHISVIAQDGSAVSVTSTINQIFGSMVYSPRTGVIFNNELADFCKVPDSRIHSGEMPPSAMTPAILISKDKKSQLVIGGAGGDMIISATALAIMNKLWFGYDLEKAISAQILYVNNQNEIQLEPPEDELLKNGLRNRGHQIKTSPYFLNVVQAVLKQGPCIYAESDKRKRGIAAGY